MDLLVRDLARFSRYPVHEHGSVATFLASEPKSGISSIAYGDGVLDLLFLDRQAATTIVVFHAAVPLTVSTMPVFNALSVTSRLDANVVCVSDPTIARGVRLGWFAGNEQQPLQRDLPAVLEHYQRASTGGQHVVLFGASGGGFASLYYASQLPGSLALAVNPQTSIARFYAKMVRDYARAAWSSDAIADAAAVIDLTSERSQGLTSTVAYVQNLGDGHHLGRHLRPWLEAVGVDERSWTLFGEWGEGHNPPPSETTKELLAMTIEAEGDWDAALRGYGFVQSVTSADVDEQMGARVPAASAG